MPPPKTAHLSIKCCSCVDHVTPPCLDADKRPCFWSMDICSHDADKGPCLQTKEELNRLRREVVRSPKSPKTSLAAQAVLRRVENERDEALSQLRKMSTERDSLRERLKVCCCLLRSVGVSSERLEVCCENWWCICGGEAGAVRTAKLSTEKRVLRLMRRGRQLWSVGWRVKQGSGVSVEFLRALGSPSGVSVWQPTLVG